MLHTCLVPLLLWTVLLELPFCRAIIGGRNASGNQFPFIASLRSLGNEHIDSGSVISHRFVLTSAWTLKYEPARVVVGLVQLNSGGISYRVARTIPHPRYDELTFSHNVGLIQTLSAITFSDAVRAIPIGTRRLSGGVPALAAGWGDSEEARKSRTNHLRWATFVTLEDPDCAERLRLAGMEKFHNPHLICAEGYPDDANVGQAWCPYDFGGPLTSGFTLVGVLFRPGMQMCSVSDKFPSVAHRVEPFLFWIMQNVIENE